MRFDIVTIFPAMFDSYLNESLLRRAQKKGIVEVRIHNLRTFSTDRHKKVDDRPYGGGPGMVVKVEPVYRAVRFLKSKVKSHRSEARVILFSTRGKKLDAKTAKRLAKYDRLILICGRYEGVDERVATYIADEEISIGKYVLSGGELPALVLVESVSRFLPGFLGKKESLEEYKGSYPVYTKPAEFAVPRGDGKKLFARAPSIWKVPDVLLSGDHKKIAEYRKRK